MVAKALSTSKARLSAVLRTYLIKLAAYPLSLWPVMVPEFDWDVLQLALVVPSVSTLNRFGKHCKPLALCLILSSSSEEVSKPFMTDHRSANSPPSHDPAGQASPVWKGQRPFQYNCAVYNCACM